MTTTRTADRRRALMVTAGVIAMAMLAWLAVGQTRARFSGITENAGNTFKTTSVTLTNDRATAMFNLTEMLPGHSDTQTIEISNGSAAPMGLRLFADDFVDTAGADETPDTTEIADYLDLLVTIEGPSGLQTVFDGTLAEFATATEYADGYWTCHFDNNCEQPDTSAGGPGEVLPPDGMGLLERTLRAELTEDQENDLPIVFWEAVESADKATANQQDAAEQAADDAQDAADDAQDAANNPPTPAEIYETIPSTVRNEIPGPLKTEIENAVYGGSSGSSSFSAMDAEDETPADRGDRINAIYTGWSIRTYHFTVTMRADAGDHDVSPTDSASVTFVWEGRA